MAKLKTITHKNADGTTTTYEIGSASYDRFGENQDGLVPGPNKKEVSQQYYLAGNGYWYPVSGIFAKNDDGLVPRPGNDLDNDSNKYNEYYLGADVAWHHLSTASIFQYDNDGLVPKPNSIAPIKPSESVLKKYYLSANQTWEQITEGGGGGTTYDVFTDNTNGLVPAPRENSFSSYYLGGDHLWHSLFDDQNPGLVRESGDFNTEEYYLGGDGNWHILSSSSVFTNNTNGLVPAPGEKDGMNFYLGGDSLWHKLTSVSIFDTDNDGLVPAPSTYPYTQLDPSNYYLAANGMWEKIPSSEGGGGGGGETTYDVFTKDTNGLVPSPGDSKANSNYVLAGDGNWRQFPEEIRKTTSVTNPHGIDVGLWITTESGHITGEYLDGSTIKTGNVSIPRGSLYISCGPVTDNNYIYEGYYFTSKGIYHGTGYQDGETTWTLITPNLTDTIALITLIVEQYI